jgi:hypothetical protein
MKLARQHSPIVCNVPRLLLVLACLAAAPATSRASPCYEIDYLLCSTSPDAYRIQFNFTSTIPLTHIVDGWGGSSPFLKDQGDFSSSSQVSLPSGSGVIDAGYWVGEDQHYLLALTDVGGTDHLVVMMSPSTAALAAGRPLEDIINGNPVDPFFQIPVGDAEASIIVSLKTQGVEWDTDIDQFFRFSSRYPNRLLPGLQINATGTYEIGGPAADFVMVMYSSGTVVGTVGVEVTPVAEPAPVPEPASWLSLLAGIGLLALWRRPGHQPAQAR